MHRIRAVSPAVLLVVVGCAALNLVALGCASPRADTPPSRSVAPRNPALDALADPQASESQAVWAAERLAAAADPPDARRVLAVADDPRLSGPRRRQAVLLFWHRHGGTGASMASIAEKLRGGKSWLNRASIAVIPGFAGSVPLKEMSPGTVFRVRIGLTEADRSTIYVRVEGRLREEQVASILLDTDAADGLARGRVLDVGYSLAAPSDRSLVDDARASPPRDVDDELLGIR